MTVREQSLLRGAIILVAIGVTVGSVFAWRAADLRIYLVFVLLSLVLFRPWVEVVPGLGFPLPGLVLTIGFLYIGGAPILALRNVAPLLTRGARTVLPPRLRRFVPELIGAGEWIAGRATGRGPRSSAVVAADWSVFTLGLGARWLVASVLASDGPPVTRVAVVLIAELCGYATWAMLSMLPIFSFRPVVRMGSTPLAVRPVLLDLGLMSVATLTPFVLLVVYGFTVHGVLGAAGWSLAALGLHIVLKNLTERRELVATQSSHLETLHHQLRHRERLSAIGQMSSVISHQLLQQLGVIGLHADLIRQDHGGEPSQLRTRAQANAEAIESALRDINAVLRDLLVFGRDLRVHPYAQRLVDVMNECAAACASDAEQRRVTIDVRCATDLVTALDRLKVTQAIVNVLRNGIEACPPGGTVTVSARRHAEWVEIRVSDQGPGIPESDRDAIFAPFFTTKPGGTGLGLAIARAFMEAHGGAAHVEDAASSTTIVLRLPWRLE